jgi:hypothetical protein
VYYHGEETWKEIVPNARSGNGFCVGRDGLCWLAGFCLVVDLKCGFVETVAYPMGSALYILCNTLFARSIVCCIFVPCCFYTIITLFLWRQLASFVMLDSAGYQAWNLCQYTSIMLHYMIIELLNCYVCLGEYSGVNNCSDEGACCLDWLGLFFNVNWVTKLVSKRGELGDSVQCHILHASM